MQAARPPGDRHEHLAEDDHDHKDHPDPNDAHTDDEHAHAEHPGDHPHDHGNGRRHPGARVKRR